MGVRVELSPHLLRLMSSDDQARYGGAPDTQIIAADTPTTSSRRDADERREQGGFANWLLLQNSQGRKIPYVWHSTHRPSTASVGCPISLSVSAVTSNRPVMVEMTQPSKDA
jgi:hypothetical protein